VTTSSWLNFSRPAPPGRGLQRAKNFRSTLLQPTRGVWVASERFFSFIHVFVIVIVVSLIVKSSLQSAIETIYTLSLTRPLLTQWNLSTRFCWVLPGIRRLDSTDDSRDSIRRACREREKRIANVVFLSCRVLLARNRGDVVSRCAPRRAALTKLIIIVDGGVTACQCLLVRRRRRNWKSADSSRPSFVLFVSSFLAARLSPPSWVSTARVVVGKLSRIYCKPLNSHIDDAGCCSADLLVLSAGHFSPLSRRFSPFPLCWNRLD